MTLYPTPPQSGSALFGMFLNIPRPQFKRLLSNKEENIILGLHHGTEFHFDSIIHTCGDSLTVSITQDLCVVNQNSDPQSWR